MAAKEVLILLPGILSDAEFWSNQLSGLAEFCMPQPGDVTKSASIPDMARDVLYLAPERFALAGLSLGGYVAFEIMRMAPERVTRVAFMDTHARQDPPDSAPRRDAMGEMARSGRYSEIMPMLLPSILHPDHVEELTERLVAMANRVGPQVFLNHLEAMKNRADSRLGLGNITVPTLVLCGDADSITPPALAEEIAEGIPRAKLVIVERAGHLPPLEQPDSVNRALADWLLER